MRAVRLLGICTVLVLGMSSTARADWTFIRGDANGDGSIDIADAVNVFDYLFSMGSTNCLDALDANDDGTVNIADAVRILDWLFSMGPDFPLPFPDCGEDPTADMIDCVGPLASCPDGPTVCTDNVDCPAGEYCEKAVGDCNGMGTCMVMPFVCPLIFDPVCGCDGMTYDNACNAAAAGVNVDFAGPCSVVCTDNVDCPAGEYCEKAVGDCNGLGVCIVMPFICPLIYDPVCGCDGMTYGNACNAAAAGVNVDFTGPCPAGCTDNSMCPAGEYCEKAVGDCNGMGTCAVMPFICPLIYDPVCGCDGMTYGNACNAAAAGVNVDFTGPCPAGCTDNSMCPAGEYCEKAVGDCNGMGTCAVMPFICPLIYDPVCGCDGMTYGNACNAAAAGVNVDFTGPCPAGCTDNSMCPAGEYCEKAVGDCNGMGTCAVMPFICPLIYDPVCGCDGMTYGNACNAAAAGVNVDFTGPCPAGCTDNSMCPAGEYCEKAVGDCNGMGTCAVMPFICPLIYDPVCGCDGMTYGNACNAAAAGINVDFTGPCP